MTAPILTIAIVLTAFFLVFYVFFPLGRGAIYVPSTHEKAAQMAELSALTQGEKSADLGSGDGRVVIACARRGAEAHGFEVNPILVLLSRRNIRRAGLQGKAFIHCKSFWRARLSPFQVVTLFQGSFVMRRLEAKVRREMEPGTRVISDYWGFPKMVPESTHGTLCCYRMPPPDGTP
jgi:ribosomal protein L11 methylase PrmA